MCDYRNNRIPLFTTKEADFEEINLPLYITSEMRASVVAESTLKVAASKLSTKKEEKRLAPTLVSEKKVIQPWYHFQAILHLWRKVSHVKVRG